MYSIFLNICGAKMATKCGFSKLVVKTHGIGKGAHRCFHGTVIASGKKSVTSKDTRLAGRLRFYKEVGVTELSPPWEEPQKHEGKKQHGQIKSPISAGVDGSNSASGVQHLSQSKEGLEWMLTPRKPGSTEVASSDDTKWFGVTLDGRTIQTPMGQKLAVPSELLAYAIASEWDAQAKYLQPTNMPLMTLACTALDQAAHHPHVYQEQSLNFLPTDTTCFWADPMEDRVLQRRQEQAWKELHDFVESRFNEAPARAIGLSEGMLMSRKRGDRKPSAGLPHPQKLVDDAAKWTRTLDAWHLVALSSICAQAKSFFVAWALLEPNSPLEDMAKATAASRVEEEFQISNWGLVEGGHDYDRLNCSIQLASAKIFTRTIATDNNLHK